MVIPSIYLPKHAYVASDGNVTIWRRSTKRLRSVIIKELSQHWGVASPSGPYSYPVFPISRHQYRSLVDLADRLGKASRIANADLPHSIQALLASKPLREASALALVESVMEAF